MTDFKQGQRRWCQCLQFTDGRLHKNPYKTNDSFWGERWCELPWRFYKGCWSYSTIFPDKAIFGVIESDCHQIHLAPRSADWKKTANNNLIIFWHHLHLNKNNAEVFTFGLCADLRLWLPSEQWCFETLVCLRDQILYPSCFLSGLHACVAQRKVERFLCRLCMMQSIKSRRCFQWLTIWSLREERPTISRAVLLISCNVFAAVPCV